MKTLILGAAILLIACHTAKETTAETGNKSPEFNAQKISQEKKRMDKETLAKRIEPTDADAAQIIRAADAKLEQLPAQFMLRGALYRVEKFAKTRPIILHVGCGETNQCVLLGGDETGFFDFASQNGLDLTRKEARISYALTFLMLMHPAERLQILNSVGDIKPRPNLNEEQQQQFKAFQEKFAGIVTAPNVLDVPPFHATVFAVKGQNLVKIELTISPDGKITTAETVLEKDLLIPYAL